MCLLSVCSFIAYYCILCARHLDLETSPAPATGSPRTNIDYLALVISTAFPVLLKTDAGEAALPKICPSAGSKTGASPGIGTGTEPGLKEGNLRRGLTPPQAMNKN